MSRQPFLLKARRGIWYYKLPDETCYHTTHIPHTRKADRDVAAAWVLDLIARPAPLDPLLEDFARGFYRWPDSSYITRQLAKGRPFGKAHADLCQGYLDRYILPAFGRRRLSQLMKSEIEDRIIRLDLANATKNHMLYALRAVLQEAVDAGALAASPLARVESLGKAFRARDVFLGRGLPCSLSPGRAGIGVGPTAQGAVLPPARRNRDPLGGGKGSHLAPGALA